MQVIPASTGDARAVVSPASLLWLPELLKLTSLSPQTQALREQQAARQRAKDRQQEELAAVGAGSPARAAAEADRKLSFASRSGRQQMLGQAQQKDAQQRAAFQRTLIEARPQSATPASADKAETPSSSGVTAPRSAPTGREGSTPSAQQGAGEGPRTSSPPAQPTTPADPQSHAPVNLSARGSGQTGGLSYRNPATQSPQPSPAVTRTAAATGVVERIAGTRTAASAASQTSQVREGQPSIAAVAQADARPRAAAAGSGASRGTGPSEPQPGRTDANIERILRVLRGQIGRDHARVTLRLDPPELGTIRLRLDLRQDVLTLRIDTQTAVAQRLLSEQLESLRQGLQAMGIHLERVDIRPPAATAEADHSDQPPQPQERHPEGEHSATADAEQPPDRGTDSPLAAPAEGAARDAIPEPATESLVNLWA